MILVSLIYPQSTKVKELKAHYKKYYAVMLYCYTLQGKY